jgi:Skp family chaperone for outer membrane proteins
LKAEERKLTDQRSKLSPDAFSGLADAFDEKVQKTRAAQAAKGRALNELVEKERQVFLAAAGPVLEQMMREAGAAVILERRSVFVSANAIDITDEAIERLDASVGSGKN